MAPERFVTLFDCAKCPHVGKCDAHGYDKPDVWEHRRSNPPCQVSLS